MQRIFPSPCHPSGARASAPPPGFPALQRVIVTITTTDGRSFTKQLDYPKGDPRNPLSDGEIEEKFAALADGVLTQQAQAKLKDAIWNLEKIGSVTKLMALMKADVGKKSVKPKPKPKAKPTSKTKPKAKKRR